MILSYLEKKPVVDETVFQAPGSYIIGDVKIGKNSSVWFNAVLRADEDTITIGDCCSIQDNVTCHLYEARRLSLKMKSRSATMQSFMGAPSRNDALSAWARLSLMEQKLVKNASSVPIL